MMIQRKWSRARRFLALPGLRAASRVTAALLGMVTIQEADAQGTVRWGNSFSFTGIPITRSPVYGVDPANPTERRSGNTDMGIPAGTQTYGGPLLQGTGFTIAMFFGNDQQPISRNTIRTGTAAGFTTLLVVEDPTRPPGTSGVIVQFRAWDNRAGTITSWAQAMADPTIPQGVSDPFPIGLLGGFGGAPGPGPVPDTTGIRSFNLTVVPEPSLIALGAFGLGALVLRRRR